MERGIRAPLRAAVSISRTGMGTVFRLATRYPDVLIVPWLLSASVALAYLAARGASLLVPLALLLVDRKAEPHLIVLAQDLPQTPFQAAAARVNLGYLMICGALGLFVLTFMQQVAGHFDPVMGDMLIWLLVGQSTPVLFGATAVLMRVVERGAFYDLLTGITSALFIIGVALLDIRDGVLIAQAFAAAQLTLAALCALLLTQSGVWPGLTALLHKEIRIL